MTPYYTDNATTRGCAAMKKRDRILWNRRPKGPYDTGDINELAIFDVGSVHIEQMSDHAWRIDISCEDGREWSGNFVGDSSGVWFGQRANDGFDPLETL